MGLISEIWLNPDIHDTSFNGPFSLSCSADDKLMTASADVTTALQRTMTLMSTELEKSSYSSELLDESSTSLQSATAQYQSFADLVTSSRKLIASMERADMLDAILLGISLLFFLACIAYILKVRIWDRGMGLLGFLARMIGLSRSRSAADVQEKLELAKAAAQKSAEAVLASTSPMEEMVMKTAVAASASGVADGVPTNSAEHSFDQQQETTHLGHDEL